jgi:Arc/MetJ-type ribon-helix-helix transcriptional regulator
VGRLDALVRLLERTEGADTVVTSVRLPGALRDAVRLAVAMGMDPNVNDAANQALRARLEAFVQRTALDEHYRSHPGVRPSLAETALALAELEASSLAATPRLIERAAAEVVRVRPDADADDVLLWAESLRAHERAATSRRRAAG